MTKFVWIFGPTAVGKNELIQKMISNPTDPLLLTLSLQQPIIANESSLLLRQHARDSLVEEIVKDKSKAKTILIKGQGFDITDGNNIPKRLKDSYPNDEHIYIYLDASAETLKNRREKRGEANSIDDEGARKDMLRIAKEFEGTGINFKWLNNDNDQVPVEITRPV